MTCNGGRGRGGGKRTQRTRKQTTRKRRANQRTRKQQTRKRATHQPRVCGPPIRGKSRTNGGVSCYYDDQLRTMKEGWNRRHAGHQQQIHSNHSAEIHRALTERLQDRCGGSDNDICWIKQQDLLGPIDKSYYNAFAPRAPKKWNRNPNEWLTSEDILKVMWQYERAYPHFKFIGPSPIDFDKREGSRDKCVWQDLCQFNLKRTMARGIREVGIIWNTDPSTKGGAHWMSAYINIPERWIFFFDSTGDPALPEVQRFIERVVQQGRDQGIRFTVDSNEGIEHQRGNTECGIYSLYFIVHLLEKKATRDTFKRGGAHRITDAAVEKWRRVYFNSYRK